MAPPALTADDPSADPGSLDGSGSPVAGKMGYAQAPVVKTKSSGWLYTWAWGMEKAAKHADDAWKFISWASGKDYLKLAGTKLGWASVPAGTRNSLYENADYQKAATAFYKQTQTSITTADPKNPGVQPRPTIGIQFVDIPEFTDLGTKVSQSISSAIAGQMSVEQALAQGQQLAAQVATKYQKK